MKLTQREKTLLMILGALLLFCGIIFLGILPQQEEKQRNIQLINQNQAMMSMMQQKVVRFGTQDDTIQDLKQKTDEALEYIMKDLTNEQLDDLIRSLTEECKITIASLTISDAQMLVFDQFINEEEETLSYPIKEYLAVLNEVQEQYEEPLFFQEVYLLKNTITLNFTGTFNQLTQMVELVRALDTTLYVEETQTEYDTKTRRWQVQLVMGAYFYEEQQ